MNSTACSQCGEKILPHWILCPACGLPFADAITPGSDTRVSNSIPAFHNISCIQCKGVLTPDAQICPNCHVLIVRRYCSGCSRLIPEQAGLCPYCETPATAKRSRLKLYLRSAVILFGAASILAGILFLVYQIPVENPKAITPVPVTNAFSPPEPAATILTAVQQKDPEPEQMPEIAVSETKSVVVETTVDVPRPITEPLTESGDVSAMTMEEQPKELSWESRGARLKQGRQLTVRATQLMEQGRYTDASVLLTDAVKIFPTETKDLSYGEALYKLGICLRRKGKPEQAIPVLREAMRFPYYRSRVLREVEAATSQMQKIKLNHQSPGRR